MELGEVLINYREENRISQRELARRCGLSHALISILEMGKNRQTGKKSTPDTETYKKLAAGMGMTVQTLFEKLGDSEMVNLDSNRAIIIPDSELFTKILLRMPPEDYKTIMEIMERTERMMRENGEL